MGLKKVNELLLSSGGNMECFDCKYHETFSDDIDGESFSDGCLCHNEKAEKYNMHFKCCGEYNGKDECPYKEIDDE